MTTSPSGILSHFPSGRTPRPIQSQVLTALEKLWDTADVFCISLPTGSGKSLVSYTIGRWANSRGKGCHVVTPTNQLVDQYLKDFPEMTVLRSKGSRRCNTWGKSLSAVRGLCSPLLKCEGCERYKQDQLSARFSNLLINNAHTYIINRLFRSVLILDESHLFLPILREFSATNVWEASKTPFPNAQSTDELVRWSQETHPSSAAHKKLFRELHNHEAGKPKYHLELGWEANRGKMRKRIKMVPISLDGTPPRMWPPVVQKIILLSATIGKKDIQALGLGKKRVIFMDGESPILAAQRPVIFDHELSTNMSKSQTDLGGMERFAEILDVIARRNSDSKGVVHLTYSLAKQLRESPNITEILRSRLMFHTKETKDRQYQSFRESKLPSILVASGMYEGIDLPYDLARWQVVGKIPWGNLGDPMTKHQLDTDPDGYAWEAMKKLIQATGRTTRAEDDFSRVWITDSTFGILWKDNYMMFPKWFRDSVHEVKEE